MTKTPGQKTSLSLMPVTTEQIAALKELYGSTNAVVSVAIERLYRDQITMRLTRGFDIVGTDPGTLAFIAARGQLFDIADAIERTLADEREASHKQLVDLLRWIEKIAREATED